MYFLSYWEVFGIVLITLYFVLSLLFPKTNNNSKKEQQKPKDANSKETSIDALKHDEEKPSEEPLVALQENLVTEGEVDDESSGLVWSSLRSSSIPNTHAESTEQDVEITANSGHGVNSSSCSSLKDSQESLENKTVDQFDVVEDEGNDKAVYLEKLPSTYLYMECKTESLSPNDVSIERISDSTDKTSEISASREIQSSEITNSGKENLLSSDEVENMHLITNDLTTTQNDGNLEKFAEGLASTTIETAVDNSVCLSNFADNLSEKIFWDSADDVISEVHAAIEKQQQETQVNKRELKAVHLESLGVNVASEVVNEAIGEAALKKEYMSDDEQDVVSPQNIQPHIGYVVENVVNNAICEAALKLKGYEEDEDIGNDYGLEISESDKSKRVEIPYKSESINNVSAVLAEGSAVTGDIKDPSLWKEESTETLDIDKQSNKPTDTPLDTCSPIEAQPTSHVEKESVEPLDRPEDKQSHDPTVETLNIPAEDQVTGSDSGLCVDTTSIDHETVTELVDNLAKEPSNACSVSEPEIDHDSTAEQVTSIVKTWTETNEKEIQKADKKASTEIPVERETLQETETGNEEPYTVSDVDLVEKEKSELAKAEATPDDVSEQNDTDEAEIKKFSEVQKEGVGDLNGKTVNNNDFESHLESTTIPEITLTSDIKDSSLSSDELEEDVASPASPLDQAEKVILRSSKLDQNRESNDNVWRRSLILDLEEDFDPEESFSSDATSPDSPKYTQKPLSPSSGESDEFSDSEEDEIIDHDADAKLGAVGGSEPSTQDIEDEDFDLYDYGSDDDEQDSIFEPVLTVDGLCVSKQTEKTTKRRANLKSVDSHYNRAIIVDNGCGRIKVGYAGDMVPRVNQQTVCGIPSRYSVQITGLQMNLRDYKMYGDNAVSKAGVTHLSHPMKAGMIDNWTDVEDIWEHMIYNELGAEVGDNPIIMTEVSQNPKKNREKITQILFEHFNVPAMYLADQLPLSIYASGMTSGVCLSSGYSCSQAAVIYEGHTLSYTLQQLDIGGGHLTENLKNLLRDVRARNFTTSSGWQIVNDIKENVAFVAKDYESEIQNFKRNDSLTKYYTLPDGQIVDIGYECMACVEPLFQPAELMSADATTASQSPVHELVNNAIKRCDTDLQKMCYNHIILSGGTTTLKGFTSRLQHELHHLNHRIHKIRVPEHRQHSPWIGASILGSLPVFHEQYVTMDEYGDSGSHIIHKKCF